MATAKKISIKGTPISSAEAGEIIGQPVQRVNKIARDGKHWVARKNSDGQWEHEKSGVLTYRDGMRSRGTKSKGKASPKKGTPNGGSKAKAAKGGNSKAAKREAASKFYGNGKGKPAQSSKARRG